MRATRGWALAALYLCLVSPAAAVRPEGGDARRDARRFGVDRLNQARRKAPLARSKAAFADFNRREGGRWAMRFDPRTGRPSALVGGRTRARPGPPESAARAFLSESRDLLGLEPEQLSVERQTSGPGHAHLLYRQSYLGVPVEFARVKVHLDGSGAVTGVDSGFEPLAGFSVVPTLSAAQAAGAVGADLGAPARDAGELVIYPSPKTGRAHLAWKFTAAGSGGRWKYYVDAHTGEVLFRISPLRFATPVCLTSGVVSGLVYDLDPTQSGTTSTRPMDNIRVYVVDGTTFSTTGGVAPFNSETVASGGRGFYCNGFSGKVFSQLQGPYVNVSNYAGAAAHYDNAGGVWSTVATPVSSPHPYPSGTVVTSTINLVAVAPQAVKFLPVFTSFAVGQTAIGQFGELLDFIDNDAVDIVDALGNSVAAYVGDRGPFHGAAVPGRLMRLRLRANEAGSGTGFDVAVSSYLTLPSAGTNAYASFTWDPLKHTALSLRSEISLFYHLNKMHDYFVGGPDKSSAAFLGAPVAAMAFTGPSLVNAFYDPDLDRLFFGDINAAAPADIITDDATVPRHEYSHFVIEKIWPIQNFGQAGAISEAQADYFSASSFGNPGAPRVGLYFNQTFGFAGALRELDCAANPPCRVLTDGAWAAEIHDDSIYVGQALWDLRKDRMSQQGPVNGQACADGLFFQSLLFFPESFQELLDAMKRVDAAGTVAACGLTDGGPPHVCGGIAAGCVGSVIDAKFAAHGLPLGAGGTDPYDAANTPHNDGFETAVDITTFGVVSATIFPQTDVDFFTFGAGPGKVTITLDLPADPDHPGLFKGYMVTVYDKDRKILAEVTPPFDGFNTFDGACANDDCTTTAPSVTAEFDNPTAGKIFLGVSGGFSLDFSNSGVHSASPYVLKASWNSAGAVSGSIVTAAFDNDVISFQVSVATFPQRQDLYFAYAQLRDHAQQILPGTPTLPCTVLPCGAGGFLTAVSSFNALGKITGRVRLNAGFASRFPMVGTVHLEVFGYNVVGSTSSLGLSQPFNLTANQTEVKAWNNVFNPARGEKTTVKYEVVAPGRLTMKLYTLAGVLVATLFDAEVPRGKGSVDWFGGNSAGNTVASGLYMLHVRGPGLEKTQKIAVVK